MCYYIDPGIKDCVYLGVVRKTTNGESGSNTELMAEFGPLGFYTPDLAMPTTRVMTYSELFRHTTTTSAAMRFDTQAGRTIESETTKIFRDFTQASMDVFLATVLTTIPPAAPKLKQEDFAPHGEGLYQFGTTLQELLQVTKTSAKNLARAIRAMHGQEGAIPTPGQTTLLQNFLAAARSAAGPLPKRRVPQLLEDMRASLNLWIQEV